MATDIESESTELPIENLGGMTEMEFLQWAKQQVSRARNDRIPFERQWYLNLAFYYGRQWIQWIGEGVSFDFARLFEPKKKDWQVRLTDNKIRPRVLRQVSKMSQERPRGYVVPSTTDAEDMMAADAAEKLYEYVTTEEVELDRIMTEADWWTTICGTGFVKTYFDEHQMSKEGPMGRICVDALSPFHVFVPDLTCTDIQKQPWIAHVCTKPLEEMNQQWPDFDWRPNARSGSGSVLNDKFMSAIGVGENEANDSVMYYEMWIKTHPNFPQGVKIGWAADHVLYIAPGEGEERTDESTGETEMWGSPFVNGMEYPVAKMICRPGGKFYGDSPVTDMIPLQLEWNRSISQLIENRNAMSRPGFLAPQGSMDPRDAVAEPGAIHFYTPMGQPPTPLNPPSMPTYVMDLMSITNSSIDEQISQSDMAHGDAPGRVEAATALALLQEEANAILTLQVRDKELAIEKIGRDVLYYIHEYWEEPRLLTITGRNKVSETLEFASTSTKGNTNFKIEPGSGQPVSRAGRQALVLELMDKGALPVGEAMRFLTFGDVAKLYEDMQVDKRQAERENVKMSKAPQPDPLTGQPTQPFMAPVEMYDDDVVHIQVHDDDMKRQQTDTLDPTVVKVRKFHTYMHLKQLAAKNEVPLMVPPDIQKAEQTMQRVGVVDPNTGQLAAPPDPYFIHPLIEMELRRIFNLIVANGGFAPVAQPPSSPESVGQ